jgi:hypothetical protein
MGFPALALRLESSSSESAVPVSDGPLRLTVTVTMGHSASAVEFRQAHRRSPWVRLTSSAHPSASVWLPSPWPQPSRCRRHVTLSLGAGGLPGSSSHQPVNYMNRKCCAKADRGNYSRSGLTALSGQVQSLGAVGWWYTGTKRDRD